MKDYIDLGHMDVFKLFRRLLIPTVLGMVFSAIFVITDGIFVGKGIGSDALAAVNMTAPIFLVNTGIALMFGIGASVVASIHLSRGKLKVARINITQSVVALSFLIILFCSLIMSMPESVVRLLGCSDRLLSLALDYLKWFVPFLIFSAILSAGMFYIRLDGSPNYAMMCNIIPAVLNIILDYVFIFILKWGMFGAALATSIGYMVGAVMIIVYLSLKNVRLRFIAIKISKKSILLSLRNIGYMCRIGFSSFLCEAAIAVMMFVGNYVFINNLGEDGVAAFSIACYFFPIIFMVYNAIAQSVQPILSYNFGNGMSSRVILALRLALLTASIFGFIVIVITYLYSEEIVSLFIGNEYPAYDIAVNGMPLFASGFIFFGINIVSIGYFQSVKRNKPAMIATVLRGFVLVVLFFCIMPAICGVNGIWLAVPVSEFFTMVFISLIFLHGRFFFKWKKLV